MNLNIIGLGGTGSLLAEPLIRYAVSQEILDKVTFMDGDRYEAGNIGRQSFASAYVGTNKAAYSAIKFGKMFPDYKFDFVDRFIGKADLHEFIKSGASEATFVCVDNHYFRRIIDEHVCGLRDHLLVVSGNDLMTGQVQTHQRVSGANITKHTVCSKHSEVASASSSEDRSGMSCEQLSQLPSGGQVIAANMMSATIMLSHFISFVENRTRRAYYETCFNCTTCEVSSYGVK